MRITSILSCNAIVSDIIDSSKNSLGLVDKLSDNSERKIVIWRAGVAWSNAERVHLFLELVDLVRIRKFNRQHLHGDLADVSGIGVLVGRKEVLDFFNQIDNSISVNGGCVSSDWLAAWNTLYSTRDENPFSPIAGVDLMLERIEELETRNLSLIGHFQHSEEAFDEIKKVFEETEQRLEKQIQDLQVENR